MPQPCGANSGSSPTPNCSPSSASPPAPGATGRARAVSRPTTRSAARSSTSSPRLRLGSSAVASRGRPHDRPHKTQRPAGAWRERRNGSAERAPKPSALPEAAQHSRRDHYRLHRVAPWPAPAGADAALELARAWNSRRGRTMNAPYQTRQVKRARATQAAMQDRRDALAELSSSRSHLALCAKPSITPRTRHRREDRGRLRARFRRPLVELRRAGTSATARSPITRDGMRKPRSFDCLAGCASPDR